MAHYIFIAFANKKEIGRTNYYNIKAEELKFFAQGLTFGASFCGKKCPGVLVFEEQKNGHFQLCDSFNAGNCPDAWKVTPEPEPEDIPMF